jgi:beta-lactamase regulating signal transducer with metallopeptidase domain
MTVELVARTSALLFAASALANLLRWAAPSTRHFVWALATIGVVLAPFLIAVAPRVPIIPGVPMAPMVPTVPRASFDAVPMVLDSVQGDLGTGAEQYLWNVGTLGIFGTAVVGSWFLFCWALSGVSVWRGSVPAPERWINETRSIGRRIGVKGPIAVRQLRRDASPHVAGFFQSVVMLPPAAASWPREALQAAIVHELTHMKRHDRLTQAMAQLACAIYWFNPLVWHAAAALARERERACDDAVLRFGAKASAYASLLLNLARAKRGSWTPATALSMARPSAIEGRLLLILADAARTPRRSTRWLIGVAVIAITATALGAEVATPPGRQAPAPQARPLVNMPAVMSIDDQSARSATAGNRSDVIAPLLAALQDPDPQVREKAAIGLAFRRDPRIVDPLLVAIADPDSQVREKAAIALGASGDRRVVAALTNALKDPDSQVREKAVGGLVLLGLRPSIPPAPSSAAGRQ